MTQKNSFQNQTYDEDENVDSDVKIDGDSCNIFGENKTFDKLNVRDDLSNLAVKSDDFANF